MNKIIVVAYLNLFKGEIEQKLLPSKSGLEAMNKFLGANFHTEDEVYQYCADTDCYISYIEL